jgi:M6 family metalloprotease-like protein
MYAQESACTVTGASTSTLYISSSVNLKILLVQFTDITCKKGSGNRPKYSKVNYEEMFGSDGIYVSSVRYTPDGDAVYGSMNDYFRKMSSGNLTINATLLNQLNEEYGYPIWITLPYSKSYYHSTYDQILTDALSSANSAGIAVGTLNDYNKLVIIYAGNRYNGGGLNPYANNIGGTTYIMSELENSPMNQEHSGAKFARIGTHCHEFAHTLGIKHSSGSRSDIMEAGNRNGNFAAPAPLNPIARMLKGWLTPTTVTGQQPYDAYYSLTSPQVFRINGNVSGEYFLIENRRFDQNMTIGTTSIPDYNNSTFMPIALSQNASNVILSQGILVWRVTSNFPNQNYQDNGLIYASGRYNRSFPDNNLTETDAGDLFPGDAGIMVLSPWSDERNPYSTSYDPYWGTTNNVFVPNTKSSTNVAMEVLGVNDSEHYISVGLYQSSPVDASPSKPRNLQITTYVDGNGQYRPRLTWTAAGESDVSYGGT